MSNFKNNYSFTDNLVVRFPVFPYKTAYTAREVEGYFKTSALFREAVFLASPAAKFITGVSLPVDGGNSIGF